MNNVNRIPLVEHNSLKSNINGLLTQELYSEIVFRKIERYWFLNWKNF